MSDTEQKIDPVYTVEKVYQRRKRGRNLLICTRRKRNGQLHNEGGPAVDELERNGDHKLEYYLNGQKHREDGPAHIVTHADGSKFMIHYRHGKIHCDDGPAIYSIDANGVRTNQEYFKEGQRHRTDGPATIKVEEDHIVETYYENDKFVTDGRPSVIIRYNDGRISERYAADRENFRTDGPAIVNKYPDGIIEEIYSDDGVHIRTGEKPSVIRKFPGGEISEGYVQPNISINTDISKVPARANGKLSRCTRDAAGNSLKIYYGINSRDEITEYKLLEYTDGRREETYKENDKLHRLDGAAHTVTHPRNGVFMAFYEHGQICTHKPGNIFVYADGSRKSIYFDKYKKRHRSNRRAACVFEYSDGSTEYKHYKHGVLHNDRAAAEKTVYADGTERKACFDNGIQVPAPVRPSRARKPKGEQQTFD